MPTIIVTTRDGEAHTLTAKLNSTLMETIRDNGLPDLVAQCGGGCSCATCHVYVDPGEQPELPPQSEDETFMLESSPHCQANSRLSCQIRLTQAHDGLRVTIAPPED